MKAFFAKVWSAIKGAFSKAWSWSLGHKAVAIAVAATVVVGTTCAIVLPIALHNHEFADEWSSDATTHWHDATCKHDDEKSDTADHTYTNACDTTCDVCGYVRTVGAHAYDNACDTSCNVCNATRTVDHVYDNGCDTTCNVCSAERTVDPHVYDNDCDADCNECAATREITHDYASTLTAGETTHWYACSVCGDKKDEVNHTFDQTVVHGDYLKDEPTATTKAQYYKSCVCGKASATEYFETDKTVATLTDIQDLSKTYDKVEPQDPTYVTNSDGAVTIEWYQGATKLDAKPVNAGTYKVKVIIAENETYAGVSAEKEFTIAKKTLNLLDIEVTYDGGAIPIRFDLTAVDGVIDGDVVYLHCDGNQDYNVAGDEWTLFALDFAGNDLYSNDEYVEIRGEDAANYMFTYAADDSVGKVTVMPYVLEFTGEYVKEYDGTHYVTFTQDITFSYGYVETVTVKLPLLDLDGQYITNAGVYTQENAQFGPPEFYVNDIENFGYDLDDSFYATESEFEVTVTPIILNITYNFEYNGIEIDGIAYRQAYLTSNEHPDILAGDEVLLEAEFLGADVGANVTNENFEPGISDTYGNYAIGTCNLAIVPKVLYNVELHVTYAKTTAFSNVSVPVSAGVEEGDDYKVGIDLFDVRAGEYTVANEKLEDIYPESCADADNYSIDLATVKVVVDKRELSGSVTSNLVYGQYFDDDQYATESCPIAYKLNTSHNVFEGDLVYISSTFENRNAGAALLGRAVTGADGGNYTFPANLDDMPIDIKIVKRALSIPNVISKAYDGDGHFSYTYPTASGAYGEVVTVELDIAENAVGVYKNIAISNVKFYVNGVETTNYYWSRNSINAFIINDEFSGVELSVGSDFTEGLYQFTLSESGLYSFSGSENFFTVDAIYSYNGDKLAVDGYTFTANKGTYCVEISKASSFSPLGATVSIVKETVTFNADNLFDCQIAETRTLTLTAGELLCLKVLGGENSKMSDFEISLPTGSSASFFVTDYSLDESECYYAYQNIQGGIGYPCDSHYMDVCDTGDRYIVLYAVTSGDITVTVQ